MTTLGEKDMQNAVREVLNYFAIFSYAPSLLQIYSFLGVKCPITRVKRALDAMESAGEIVEGKLKYTGERIFVYADMEAFLKNRDVKFAYTQEKLRKVALFLKCLESIPWIQFVGISGSCSTHNADGLDDIDVFIISAPGGIWLARLGAILVAKLLHKHRKRNMKAISDKVCLNLFFDGSHITIPISKRNLYTAHEVAQVVPVMVRGRVYERFLNENNWITRYFPNMQVPAVKRAIPLQPQKYGILAFMNFIAKSLQLPRIRKNQTTEFVSDEQLWFFPQDFEVTVRNKLPAGIMKG